MIDPIHIARTVHQERASGDRPGNGNPGIVPPWLRKPPVITLPVEPPAATFLSGDRVSSKFTSTPGTVVCRVDRRHVLVSWDRAGLVREQAATLRLEPSR